MSDAPDTSDQTADDPGGKRLSLAQIRLVLELDGAQKTQAEIADVLGCNQSTVSRTLAAFSEDAKSVARLLRGLSDESIEDWREARKVAAKRGDHRPARELLEAAYPELRPQPASSGGGGFVVFVGTPGNPHNIPPPSCLHTIGTGAPQPVIDVTPHAVPASTTPRP